eukprot:1226135-Lingulodinium_polyedra.AAC.1
MMWNARAVGLARAQLPRFDGGPRFGKLAVYNSARPRNLKTSCVVRRYAEVVSERVATQPCQ